MSDENINVKLGRLIQKSRRKKGISGTELAEKLNISQQQISRYERGITKLTCERLIDLIVYLEIDFSELRTEFNSEFNNDNSNIMIL